VGEGWGGGNGSPSPLVGEGAFILPPPWWGRVGVGGEREKMSLLPVPSHNVLVCSVQLEFSDRFPP